MVYLTDLTRRPKSYATLQCGPGPDDHVLPPSDLVYGVQGLHLPVLTRISDVLDHLQLITRVIRTPLSIYIVQIVRNGTCMLSNEFRSETLVSSYCPCTR
jgi:hypothetical protein